MGKQARVKAREIRHAQAIAARRAANRSRLLLAIGGFVIVGLVAAIVAVVVTSGPKGEAATGPAAVAPSAIPGNATATGPILIGPPEAPVKVEIYLDYLCPFCGRFETTNAADIESLVRSGRMRVELYPLAFLDRLSNGSRYSTRAANAVATVADRAPEALLAFNTALFANQPAEGTPGLSDDQIRDLAVRSGVPAEVASAFTQRIFEPWIASVTSAAVAAGVSATPTVKIDGVPFKDLYAAGAFKRAVESAQD